VIVSFFGELERFFATVIFPNRGLVAVGLLVVLIALAVLARRGRWDRIVRAHPRPALAILVVVLAVGLPVTWVLASPLFIRSELVEPDPAAGAGATAAAGTTVLAGEVVGADDFHTGTGRVAIIEVAPGTHVLRFEDFSVLNGPDLHVYLSPDPSGYAVGAVDLGKLKATDGAFNYDLPAGTDLATVRSIVIWCQPFEVQFAHAELRAG
jgi:Electron transfer DM13